MIIYPTKDRIACLPVEEDEKIGKRNMRVVRMHKNQEMTMSKVIAAGPDAPFEQEIGRVQSFLEKLVHFIFRIKRRPYRIGQYVFHSASAGTLLRRKASGGGWEEIRIMHADTIQCVIDDA